MRRIALLATSNGQHLRFVTEEATQFEAGFRFVVLDLPAVDRFHGCWALALHLDGLLYQLSTDEHLLLTITYSAE